MFINNQNARKHPVTIGTLFGYTYITISQICAVFHLAWCETLLSDPSTRQWHVLRIHQLTKNATLPGTFILQWIRAITLVVELFPFFQNQLCSSFAIDSFFLSFFGSETPASSPSDPMLSTNSSRSFFRREGASSTSGSHYCNTFFLAFFESWNPTNHIGLKRPTSRPTTISRLATVQDNLLHSETFVRIYFFGFKPKERKKKCVGREVIRSLEISLRVLSVEAR